MEPTIDSNEFEQKFAEFVAEARVEDNIPKATMALLAGLEHTWFWLDAVLRIQPELLRKAGFTEKDRQLLRITKAMRSKWHDFIERHYQQSSESGVSINV